jgi:peroxiredoxin
MRKVQADVEPQEVANYEFRVPDGIVTLTELFGDHEDLMVVHNMGVSCPGCTLWADGYNGIHQHVTSRAAFVVSSPDAPEVQQKFAASRGWVFPMVSHMGNSFAQDMGYRTATRLLPGMSVFKLKANKILRVSDVTWSPGDDFCTIWHMFDLLPEGPAGWMPKLRYSADAAAAQAGTHARTPAAAEGTIQAPNQAGGQTSASVASQPALQGGGQTPASVAGQPAIQSQGEPTRSCSKECH